MKWISYIYICVCVCIYVCVCVCVCIYTSSLLSLPHTLPHPTTLGHHQAPLPTASWTPLIFTPVPPFFLSHKTASPEGLQGEISTIPQSWSPRLPPFSWNHRRKLPLPPTWSVSLGHLVISHLPLFAYLIANNFCMFLVFLTYQPPNGKGHMATSHTPFHILFAENSRLLCGRHLNSWNQENK